MLLHPETWPLVLLRLLSLQQTPIPSCLFSGVSIQSPRSGPPIPHPARSTLWSPAQGLEASARSVPSADTITPRDWLRILQVSASLSPPDHVLCSFPLQHPPCGNTHATLPSQLSAPQDCLCPLLYSQHFTDNRPLKGQTTQTVPLPAANPGKGTQGKDAARR